jgi:hypothetical protein
MSESKTAAATAPASDAPKRAAPIIGRRRTPNARDVDTMSESLRESIGTLIARMVTTGALARIADLQSVSNAYDEEEQFDNNSLEGDDRLWHTFDSVVSGSTDKKRAWPITVMTDAKIALTSLLVAIADLANTTGKLPVDAPVEFLVNTSWRESNIIRLQIELMRQQHLISNGAALGRNLDFPEKFRQKFEALVRRAADVDPGSATIAKVFMMFIKFIAWHAGTTAYEQGRVTLNRKALCTILASFESMLPAAAAPLARDTLNFVHVQLDRWDALAARTKLAESQVKKEAERLAAVAKAKAAKAAAAKGKGAAAAAKTVAKPTAAKPAVAKKPAAGAGAPAAKNPAAAAAAKKPAASKPAASKSAAPPVDAPEEVKDAPAATTATEDDLADEKVSEVAEEAAEETAADAEAATAAAGAAADEGELVFDYDAIEEPEASPAE